MIITDIERRITELSDGEFQKLCDALLHKRTNGVIHGLGMKSGTLKATIGNPDTYFRNEDGKYVFVTYTIQQKDIFKKLREDIEKCLDLKLMKVDYSDIAEIISCHTSSNLSVAHDKELHRICEEKGVKLTILGVDEIAFELWNNHRSIVKDFLNLPIDTNQLVDIEYFIKSYDANTMAAPLDIDFLFRDDELKTVEKAIIDEKVVILHGKPGVGKTRLAIEAIKNISCDSDYKVICLKNRNVSLYEDLIHYLDATGKYLLFLDDANEIEELKLVLSYVNEPNFNVKVIATVRDYAKKTVIDLAKQYAEPFILQINPFTDEEVKKFVSERFNLQDNKIVNRILELSEGNPRMAYMAGKVASEEGDFLSVHNAIQLYENYYQKNIEILSVDDRKLIVVAGIISAIKVIHKERLHIVEGLLQKLNISEEELWDRLYILFEMEFVDIKDDMLAIISDQCFANYMLYYSMIRTNVLPLQIFIEEGYINFPQKLVESINAIFNLFRNEKDIEQVISTIKCVWDKLKKEQNPNFDQFVKLFHSVRPEETFNIVLAKINAIKQEEINIEDLNIEDNYFLHEDDVLPLLSGYGFSEDLEIAIELVLMYASKSTNHLNNAYRWLKTNYGINANSYDSGYYNELIIAKVLKRYCYDNLALKRFALEWASYNLDVDFSFTETGRNHTINFVRFSLLGNNVVEEYRKAYWNIMIDLANDDSNKNLLINFLEHYSKFIQSTEDERLLEFDKQYIDKLIKILANYPIIIRCIIFESLIKKWENKNINCTEYKKVFECDEWNLYSVLKGEFVASGLDYEEYRKKHKSEIKAFTEEIDKNDIDKIVILINSLAETDIKGIKSDEWQIIEGLQWFAEALEDENLFLFINAYIKYGKEINFNPKVVIEKVMKVKGSELVYNTLNRVAFPQKNVWQYTFFEILPENEVDNKMYEQLIDFFRDDSDKEIASSYFRDLKFLEKYRKINPDIYTEVAKIILKKKNYNPFIVKIYFVMLFHLSRYSPQELIDYFKSDIKLLKEIYFFCISNYSICDYTGEFLEFFVENSNEWIEQYAQYFCSIERKNLEDENGRIASLWNSDNYINLFDIIVNNILENEILSNFEKSDMIKKITSNNGEKEMLEKQKIWIKHLIKENALNEKIYIIFDAVSERSFSLMKECVTTFLKYNKDIKAFSNIPFVSRSWSSVGEITGKINFLKELSESLKGIEYIEHRSRIQQEIEFWTNRIKAEEIDDIYLDYQW